MALVVDDEPGLRLLIPAMLEELGIASETAPSGEEALSKLERRPIDMVLADLHLAGMDGGELFRRVTAWRPDLARRFLFVTGDWLSSESRTLLEQTQCPFLRKPFEVEELLDAVRRLIRSR